MTRWSVRIADEDAFEADRWAGHMGMDRSEFLRLALHQHLLRLESEVDAATWESNPPSAAEESIASIAEWGPAEDWSDWIDAPR